MALVVKDRVKETAAAPGTGAVTLGGAAAGFQAFSAIGDGNTTYFTIVDPASGAWEVNSGTYTAAGTTLSRNATPLSSSAAGALVNFTGSVDVFCTYPSEVTATSQVGDIQIASDTPTGPGTWLETGKYYSKAAYPDLASTIGDIADIGSMVSIPQAQLPQPFSAPSARYTTATNGVTTVAVGTSGAIQATTDGITWTGVPSFITTDFSQVQYLNGNFVAVSGNGTSTAMVTSTDGLNWVPRATDANVVAGTSYAGITSVAYGAGVYVAVGSGGLIQYSSDLVDWNASSSLPVFSANFRHIIFANNLFVAIGVSGLIYTSPDGITWTSRSAGSQVFYDVIFGNGLFVAVGVNGAVYTSPDGITWTSRSAGAGTFIQAIYANSLFVAVGLFSTSLYTSTDGITWTNQSFGSGYTLSSVVWNGSNFVVVGGSGFYATSADAITWTLLRDVSWSGFSWVTVIASKTIAFGQSSCVVLAGAARTEVLQNGTWPYTVSAQSAANPRTIAYNGSNQYVVVGSSGFIATSADGLTWTGQISKVTTNFDKVCYANGNYIALGGSGSATNLLTSPDGVTWTPRTAGTAVYNAAAYGASVYVVVGASGAVYSSADLATWTSRSAGAQTFNDVIFANSLFVAVGASGTIFSSTDGATWTTRGPGGNAFTRVIYENSLFVAIGVGGAIRTSPDGITWTARTSNTTSQLNDVVWSGALFCAIGASGAIITSPDGITWTSRTGDTSVTLNSVSWSGSVFVTTNTTNAVAWTSADAITWARASTPYISGNILYSGYLGGKFLAVGNGFIEASTDAITWTSANVVQYVPTAINKLYNLGGKYFALTDKGMFQSNDGVTFSLSSRNIRSGAVYSMAYSGTAWVAMSRSDSSQPIVFYKSADGATWAVASTLGNLASVNTNAGTSVDIEYANGNFIFATTITTAQRLDYTVYTSPDAVTWTGRQTPYLALATNTLASDGTTCAFVTSSNLACKSSDGGVTWSSFVIGGTPAGYVDGVWFFGNITTTNFTDWVPSITGMFNAPYKAGDYITGTASITTRNIGKVGVYGGANIYLAIQSPVTGSQTVHYKPAVTRGSTVFLLVSRNNYSLPNLLVEAPLYSYDTATTFFVPPYTANGTQATYIYAGA